MFAPVPDSQHLRGAAATLEVTWADEFGAAAAAGGAVTVRVQTADGTDVVTAGSSTTTSETGVYQRVLAPALTASMNWLTATWTDASTSATRTTLHEIVGGFFFSIAEAIAWDDTLSRKSMADLLTRRAETEAECELITGRAWAPRYRRITGSGNNDPTFALDRAPVRSIRTARLYATPTSYTAFTSDQLADLVFRDDGTVVRGDGDVFSLGEQNVIVEFEHGLDRPPPDLRDAMLERFRDRVARQKSGVQKRAVTWDSSEGGTVTFAQPGIYSTGLPDVDAVYERYSRRNASIAGRVFDYDPTRGSLFHGMRR